jgi:TolB protein
MQKVVGSSPIIRSFFASEAPATGGFFVAVRRRRLRRTEQLAHNRLLRRLVAPTVVGLCVLGVGAASPQAAPASAPQGMLVFASDRSGVSQIYSLRADGSQLGQLTRGKAADTAPLFSPDGRRIVFTRSSKQDASALWVMNADGTGQRKLAARGNGPAWSPDSRRIAYVDAPYAGAPGPLAIDDVDTGRRVVVPGHNGSPHWSADGRLIAFSRAVRGSSELTVAGGDGGGLRIIRSKVGLVLGWSPAGEIAFVGRYGTSVDLVGTDGRGAHRLLPFVPRALAWSPDGRRLALVGGRKPGSGLRVASASGVGMRDLPPQDVNYADAPVWSPDSRWIAISFAPNGSELPDLLLVAADGSSSRVLTVRIRRPWGTNYGSPSWRPIGATPARLGGRPVAPLPTERLSATTFEPGTGTIRELAADGALAAIAVSAPPRVCGGVESWEPAQKRFVRLDREGCADEGSQYEPAHGLAVAGRHVAWLAVNGGNSRETTVVTATPDGPGLTTLVDEGADEGGAGSGAESPVGHGGLLAFTVSRRCDPYANAGNPSQCPTAPTGYKGYPIVSATVWRLGGTDRCSTNGPRLCTAVAQADGELSVLAVDGGRIAARSGDGVRLLTAAGKTLRDFPVVATTAALSGAYLALRTADAIEVYETGSGRLTNRLRVAKAVRLEDLERGILVTAAGATVTLRRLADSRTVTLRTDGAAKAKLTTAGLFLAGTHRVTFLSLPHVLRQLGG